MKFHLFTDSGARLLNQTRNAESLPYDMLSEGDAVLVVRQGTSKESVLAALKEIEEYVKKDL